MALSAELVSMMGRQAARVDTTAKALRKYAEDLGFIVVTLNAVVDCLLIFGSQVCVVDWKSPHGTLTAEQARLCARGVPLKFISSPAQLDALKSELLT